MHAALRSTNSMGETPMSTNADATKRRVARRRPVVGAAPGLVAADFDVVYQQNYRRIFRLAFGLTSNGVNGTTKSQADLDLRRSQMNGAVAIINGNPAFIARLGSERQPWAFVDWLSGSGMYEAGAPLGTSEPNLLGLASTVSDGPDGLTTSLAGFKALYVGDD